MTDKPKEIPVDLTQEEIKAREQAAAEAVTKAREPTPSEAEPSAQSEA